MEPSLWIRREVGGRLYRYHDIFALDSNASSGIPLPPLEEAWNEDEDEIDIESDPDRVGYYRTHLIVPSNCIGLVLGRKHFHRKKLEEDSGAEILAPQGGESRFVIRGQTKRICIRGYNLLRDSVEKAKSKLPLTHFLAFNIAPFVSSIAASFFEEIVSGYGLPFGLCQGVGRLHLTLAVLQAYDDEEILEAKRIIENSISSRALPSCTSSLLVRGLGLMKGSPSRARVLYAAMDENDAFAYIVDLMNRISDSLREKGLLSGRYYRKPQPHITLLNAEFLRQKMRYGLGEEHISSISGMSESEFEKDQSQEYFDASSILEDYGAIEFGSIPLAELECFLCPFHENNEMTPSANPGSIDGFYPFIDSFPLSNERS